METLAAELEEELHETMSNYEDINYNRFILYDYKRCCNINKESFQRIEEKRT